MNETKGEKRIVKYLIWIAFAALAVIYFENVAAVLATLVKVCFPLILGCVFAYALNIVLKKLEKHYFPRAKRPVFYRSRRMVCILISILLILGILALVLMLVVPELVGAVVLVGNEIPVYFEKLQDWVQRYGDQFPMLADALESADIDWNTTLKGFASFAASGVGSVFGSAFSLIGAVGSSVVNFIIALIFAVFLLAGKEKLGRQITTVMRAYLKERQINTVRHVLRVTDDTFSHFVSGQCVEALILGGLCMAGMLLLRLPYAPMVGAVVGITALIPIVGAYIGVVIGAFMILTVSSAKALIFIVFILILQQVENNLIYPKVVGSSIGLPGIWVLAAITVGGGIGGVAGMIVGVPAAATLYKLLREDVHSRSKAR